MGQHISPPPPHTRSLLGAPPTAGPWPNTYASEHRVDTSEESHAAGLAKAIKTFPAVNMVMSAPTGSLPLATMTTIQVSSACLCAAHFASQFPAVAIPRMLSILQTALFQKVCTSPLGPAPANLLCVGGLWRSPGEKLRSAAPAFIIPQRKADTLAGIQGERHGTLLCMVWLISLDRCRRIGL